MANEDDKTVVEGTPPAADAAPAKKGGNKLLLYGGIGVGTIVIGVVLALFVLKPMMASSDEPSEQTAKVEKEEKASHRSKGESKSHGEGRGGGESLMYEISDIVINPAGTGGSRFLSVSFGFELDSESEVIAFRTRDAVIRDALITILSSKTVAQLTDARQKEIIRYQIKKRVTDLMKTDQLAGVYYTDFVLQ